MTQVTIIQKATYHDTQTSGVYRWKAHILDEDGAPLCGIWLNPLWWDQTIEYPLELFHGCMNCKRITLRRRQRPNYKAPATTAQGYLAT